MITRSLWLLLALVLGAGVPFVAFTYLEWPVALLASIAGVVAAFLVVRRSARPE